VKRLRKIFLSEGSAAFTVEPSSTKTAVPLIRVAKFSPASPAQRAERIST
jgi:hypothetical protein